MKDKEHFRSICSFVYTLVPPSPLPLGLGAFGSALSFSHRSLITGKSTSNQCLLTLYQINLNIAVASVSTMLETSFSPISTYDTPVVLYSFHEGMLTV